MDTKKLAKIPQSKYFKVATVITGVILVALISFAIGLSVGFHKAKYSYNWGENYERNFMGPHKKGPMGFMPDFEGRDFRNSHGTAGAIVSIANNNLVIKDRDGKENTIAVTDKTIIKKNQADISITDLEQGDQVVIVGNPDDTGVINADIIRVFDNMNNQEDNNNNSQLN